jgi:hypothetical protein
VVDSSDTGISGGLNREEGCANRKIMTNTHFGGIPVGNNTGSSDHNADRIQEEELVPGPLYDVAGQS